MIIMHNISTALCSTLCTEYHFVSKNETKPYRFKSERKEQIRRDKRMRDRISSLSLSLSFDFIMSDVDTSAVSLHFPDTPSL